MTGRSRKTAAWLLAIAACAGAGSSRRIAPAVASDEAVAILRRAAAAEDVGDPAAALRHIRELLDRSGFDALEAELRYVTLSGAGRLSLRLGDAAGALPLLRRASEMAEAGPEDARRRLDAAGRLRSWSENADGLVLLARRWPAELARLDERYVFSMLGLARSHEGAYFPLANALFEAGWTPTGFVQPSWVWLDLAVLLLDRGDADRAARVTARISGPRAIASMRVDRRFDPVRRAFPERFDVSAAVLRELDVRRARMGKEPRSIAARNQLASSLRYLGRWVEVLDLTERPVTDILGSSDASWDDTEGEGPRMMDLRAEALHALGRTDEALGLLRRASERPIDGGPNVDQTIDLASVLCEAGRFEEALSTLDRVDLSRTTPYGRMAMELVRAVAADGLGDAAGRDRALAYLREHHADDPSALQETLVRVDRPDDAARLYVMRLRDPRTREEALIEAQECDLPPAPTAAVAAWRARWRALLARPDVRSQIAKVGRIEKFEICF